MKSTRFMLIIFASLVLITLFLQIGLKLSPTPSTGGSSNAYFTEVSHDAVAREGGNFTWRITTYNKNCSTNGGGGAYFYLIVYVDGDPWWNEYNNTNYHAWECNNGSSVTRSYRISTWQTLRPVLHDFKIELYCYEGNTSSLQDVYSFSVPVAVHAEPTSLMITSYLFIYLIVMIFLAVYMLTSGSIKIFSLPHDATSIRRQPTDGIDGFAQVKGQSFLHLYLFILASTQIINVAFYIYVIPEQVRPFAYALTQVVYIITLVLVIREENSSFRNYGFLWPEETRKYVTASLLAAVSYSFVAIFAPGILQGYDIFPSPSSTEIFLLILSASVACLASETVFRGYVMSKLSGLAGVIPALLLTSVMFSLYEVPLLPFNLSHFLAGVLSLFALGVSLGVLFYQTKTLLCPAIFLFVVSLLKSLTPINATASEYWQLLLQLAGLSLALLVLDLATEKQQPPSKDEEMFFEENWSTDKLPSLVIEDYGNSVTVKLTSS